MSRKYQRDERSRQQQNWPGQNRWQQNQREDEYGGQWSRGQHRQDEWDDRTESERWQGGEHHWGNAPRDWGRGNEGWQAGRGGGWQGERYAGGSQAERFGGGRRDQLNERYSHLGGRGWYEGYTDAMHREGPYSGRGPRNYKRADNRIEEDINDRLTEHSMVDATDIELTVQNGEVTLRGHVADRESKRLAEDIAESVSGVKEINNQIRIRQRGESEESTRQTDTGKRKAS
jgi:osmotically-inducible protein OsmY